ncbi:MAG: TIGR01440 family protein [Lachnospiraceae bacterium]|nr:TIGR01440 family protein [Lachnospiraceae bacterium]
MSLYEESYNAARELIQIAKLEAGDILVVGCSTSEVSGSKIGSASRPELAEEVFTGIYTATREADIYLAAQCCEHLNRALIIEKELAKALRLDIVNVVPQPKAGGSFATKAYAHFTHPVAVEHIRAEAGMDIGDTLIGMHLKDVAVPVRLSMNSIGEAHLVCARTRAKYIGGQRAQYDAELG